MKKSILFLTTFILLLGFSYAEYVKAEALENSVSASSTTGAPATPSSTDSVIALLLYPHIDKAIQDYFGKPTQFALYDAKVDSITKKGTDFSYQVTVSVPTFHGAHNPPYGLEILTFTISPYGVTLDNYQHKNVAP